MRAHCESADQCFRQYCETGDPVALGEVFDSTAGPLMRVALWLVGIRPETVSSRRAGTAVADGVARQRGAAAAA